MPLNHYIQPGDNPDITKERKTATFDTYELTCELHGGSERVERRRAITKKVASESAFANPIPLEFLTREKKIENAAQKSASFIQMAPEFIDDPSDQMMLSHYSNEVFGNDGMPIAVHGIMFLPALMGQAGDELGDEFIPRAAKFEILGTYAQTELGHGTNLKALETTATYDKKTQEFVIHTPTTSAMKWWPGNLGKMSNYAVVTAVLFIDSKNYGPHNFLVQIRDEKTHHPLKGVTVGDIGPKMSFNTTDNGFLAFDHYRIPRKNMLMKHSKVSPDGVYTPPTHAKLNYGAMVHVRSHMIYLHGYFMAIAAIVATRYSAVRRQGTIDKGAPEVQILDYQTQQHRIFPQIARAYAYLFVGVEVKSIYDKAVQGIAQGNTDILPDLHAITSGLKSVVTYEAGKAIEQCRMSCGGHGYSEASGLPQLYGVQIGGCTYEGENMVMLQQLARYLVKAVDAAAAGQPLAPSVAYLGKTNTSARSLIGTATGEGIEPLLDAIEHAARRLTREAADKYSKRIAGGESGERAWNNCTVELNRASRIHTRLYIAHVFARRVAGMASNGVRAALTDLLTLYLHYECVDMAQHLLEDGYCSGEQVKYLKKRMYEDLTKVRPNAVSLVDAFDYSDRNVNSVLGRRDGNVYDALYAWAKKSQLNYTDVLPAVTKYIKPLQAAQSKL